MSMSQDTIEDGCALVPWVKRGDNFLLGPYHFVCMGFQHGRMRAMRHDRYGFHMHFLTPELAFEPDFRVISRAGEVKS